MNSNSPTDKRVSNDPKSPFAVSELLDRCMGSATVAAMVLDKFENQLENDIAQMQKQHSEGDPAQLARTAHALKGAAGAVAASALHDLAAQLESMARENRIDTISKGIASIRDEVDRCLEHLPAARRALASAVPGGPAGMGAAS